MRTGVDKVSERIDGVVIGALLGFGDEGPLVIFPRAIHLRLRSPRAACVNWPPT